MPPDVPAPILLTLMLLCFILSTVGWTKVAYSKVGWIWPIFFSVKHTKPLKIDHWKRRFLLETNHFWGELLVFREWFTRCAWNRSSRIWMWFILPVILPVGIDWMGFIRMKSGFFSNTTCKEGGLKWCFWDPRDLFFQWRLQSSKTGLRSRWCLLSEAFGKNLTYSRSSSI